MFCTQCGTAIPDLSKTCPSCANPVGESHPASARAKEAGQDALRAARTIAKNPVGGLATAIDALGPTRSTGAGVVMALAFAGCVLAAVYKTTPMDVVAPGFEGFLKALLVALVPAATLTVALVLIRTVLRGRGSAGTDLMIASAGLLPIGALMLLIALLGVANAEAILIVVCFAICLHIQMLFAGLTRVSGLSDLRASLAVPTAVLLMLWLTKVVYASAIPVPMPVGLPWR
jgi:hypothetical protein